MARFNADIIMLEKVYELIWGQDRFFKVIQLEFENYKEVYEVLKKYCTPKRMLSYVDASLIFLYQKYKADYILTFDSHFDNILERLY